MTNRLAEQRKLSRLTQAEVAKALDIDVTTVSRHENSSRGLTREMIQAYSGLYKIESHELFIDLDDLDPKPLDFTPAE